MEDCLFCKIISGVIPSKKVFENEKVYAFEDIHPQADTHLLFLHKNHTTNINEMSKESNAIGEVFSAIADFTKDKDLSREGFRVVTNLGKNAGQTVFHTHFHVVGGEVLGHFGRR
ncbi:MAG: HIT domain-containing protein [Bacteriovorax sp.]|nr:HIT domain-containing protein [Bacteriovorax sp.]